VHRFSALRSRFAWDWRRLVALERRFIADETRLRASGPEQQEEAHGKQQLESLRAAFVAAGDEINLLWLDYRLAGIAEPAEMERLSGRDVGEFYRAADRRKRHTARLVAAQGNA
jgi:hypothetical protein